MKITESRVKKLNDSKSNLIGVASVVLDNEFVVEHIKIIQKDDKRFLAFPSRLTSEGKYKDIAHPITAETRKKFEDIILKEFE